MRQELFFLETARTNTGNFELIFFRSLDCAFHVAVYLRREREIAS